MIGAGARFARSTARPKSWGGGFGSDTLIDVPTLFRRKSNNDAAETTETTVAGTRSKSYTPSKKDLGKATPKRVAFGRTIEKVPTNRREAMKRMRQKQREARLEARKGMMEGKEEHLLPRDKGPERALVRNIVDARRNVASYFLPVALLVVIGANGAMPPAIRLAANMLWFALAAGVIVDSYVLSIKIKKLLTARFPNSDKKPSKHYWYGIFRSISMRRMRIPAPKVKLGEKL
jgi:hypothetical protein